MARGLGYGISVGYKRGFTPRRTINRSGRISLKHVPSRNRAPSRITGPLVYGLN